MIPSISIIIAIVTAHNPLESQVVDLLTSIPLGTHVSVLQSEIMSIMLREISVAKRR